MQTYLNLPWFLTSFMVYSGHFECLQGRDSERSRDARGQGRDSEAVQTWLLGTWFTSSSYAF